MEGSMTVSLRGAVHEQQGKVYLGANALEISSRNAAQQQDEQDEQVASVPTLRCGDLLLYLTPELKPVKQSVSSSTEYILVGSLVAQALAEQETTAQVADRVVLTLRAAEDIPVLDDILALHTSFASTHTSQLAIVDAATGTVVSTVDSFDVDKASLAGGHKTDPVLLTEATPLFDATKVESDQAFDSTVDRRTPPPLPARPNEIQQQNDQQEQQQQQQLSNTQKQFRGAADKVATVSLIASGMLTKQAENLAAYLERRSSEVQRSDAPAKTFDPKTLSRMQMLKGFAVSAHHLTSAVVKTAKGAAGGLGKRVGSRVDKNSDTFYIISKGLMSWNNISEGVEYSFRVVGQSAGKSTVEIVQKKYGDEASILAQDLSHIGNNLILVYFDAAGIGRKAIIKGALKAAIKAH